MSLRVSSKIVQIWNWLSWKWIQSELFTQMLSSTYLTYRNSTFLKLGLCLSFQTWMELKSWSLSDLIGPKSELFHKKYVITALELEVCKYNFSTCSSILSDHTYFWELLKIRLNHRSYRLHIFILFKRRCSLLSSRTALAVKFGVSANHLFV
jgi:hypothetical protein